MDRHHGHLIRVTLLSMIISSNAVNKMKTVLPADGSKKRVCGKATDNMTATNASRYLCNRFSVDILNKDKNNKIDKWDFVIEETSVFRQNEYRLFAKSGSIIFATDESISLTCQVL